jgi:hypothetical protein
MSLITTPPPGESFRKEGGDSANLKVVPQDDPNLSVKITDGSYWDLNGSYIEFTSGSSISISRPNGTNQTRFVMIGLDDVGNAQAVVGTAVVVTTSSYSLPPQPELPDTPSGGFLPLGAVRVKGTDTQILDNHIFDLRTAQKMTF